MIIMIIIYMYINDKTDLNPLQPPFRRPNRLFQAHDLYWRSPEFGDLWCNSRQAKKTIPSACEVCCRLGLRDCSFRQVEAIMGGWRSTSS